jgi:hypothetical protein
MPFKCGQELPSITFLGHGLSWIGSFLVAKKSEKMRTMKKRSWVHVAFMGSRN